MQETTDKTTMIAMGVAWSIVTVSLKSESYGGLPPTNKSKSYTALKLANIINHLQNAI